MSSRCESSSHARCKIHGRKLATRTRNPQQGAIRTFADAAVRSFALRRQILTNPWPSALIQPLADGRNPRRVMT